MAGDEQEIARTLQAYNDACKAGDVDAYKATLAEDVVFSTPNQPPLAGREAVGEWAKGFFDFYEGDLDARADRIEVVGSEAFTPGSFTLKLTPRTGGDAFTVKGQFFNIFRKEADGSWKYIYSIHNFDQPLPEPGDVEEKNKATVLNWIENGWNSQNPDLIDELFAPGFVLHGTAGSREEWREFVATAIEAFPDVHITVEDQVARADKVVTRWTMRGTHKGEFMGFPPSGKRIESTGMNISRFENGIYVEDWGNWDSQGLLEQLR